jgi:hypothetical protein
MLKFSLRLKSTTAQRNDWLLEQRTCHDYRVTLEPRPRAMYVRISQLTFISRAQNFFMSGGTSAGHLCLTDNKTLTTLSEKVAV